MSQISSKFLVINRPSFKEKETTIDKVPQNNPKDELGLEKFTDESGSTSSSKQQVDDDDDGNSNNKMKIIMIVMMMVMKMKVKVKKKHLKKGRM